MTEKQGGSDVRANTTRAAPADGGYVLTGHKWFCSAPMSDLFLVLAQTAGRTVVLRRPPLATGRHAQRHPHRAAQGQAGQPVQRVQRDRARRRRGATLLGEEGAGVATIIRMVNHTRLDCVIGVTGQMRAGLTQAIHHTRHRSAFGKLLVDQPLMRQVLADLAVESEAATLTMLRLAAAYDAGDERVQPPRHRRRQVLVLQAHADVRRRGAGVLRRQRLRGDRPDGPAVPGEPAQRDLGGQRQRHRPRRAAGDHPRAGFADGAAHRDRDRRPVPTPASTASSPTSTPSSPSSATASRRPRRDGSPSASPWRCRARCCCATRSPPSPTRSARRAWPGPAG